MTPEDNPECLGVRLGRHIDKLRLQDDAVTMIFIVRASSISALLRPDDELMLL